MYNINILSRPPHNIFGSQIDKLRYPESKFKIYYNSTEDIIWDLVVVYENICNQIDVKVKEGGLIYFSGEPPMMHPLPSKFLAQFDTVVLPHADIKHPHVVRSHGFLNWLFGYKYSDKKQAYTYEELKNLNVNKTKNISIITSSQKMMPGHSQRMHIIDSLKRDFPGQIDYFGRGICPVDSKSKGILPYRFHICIENTRIPYYWTEKIADPLLGYAVPVYCGCTNIQDYFGDSIITFSYNEYDKLKNIIDQILLDPVYEYEKHYKELCTARTTLLEKENLIPYIIENHLPIVCGKNKTEKKILPYIENLWSLDYIVLRLKRLAYRILFRIKNAIQ